MDTVTNITIFEQENAIKDSQISFITQNLDLFTQGNKILYNSNLNFDYPVCDITAIVTQNCDNIIDIVRERLSDTYDSCFYKIIKVVTNDNLTTMYISNVFTSNIVITILLINKYALHVQTPYFVFGNETLLYCNANCSIMRYYFDKYNLDRNILKIITISSLFNKFVFYGKALRNILLGITPTTLRFSTDSSRFEKFNDKDKEKKVVNNHLDNIKCYINTLFDSGLILEKKYEKIGYNYDVTRYSVYDGETKQFIVDIDIELIKIKTIDIYNTEIFDVDKMYLCNNMSIKKYCRNSMYTILHNLNNKKLTLLQHKEMQKYSKLNILREIAEINEHGYDVYTFSGNKINLLEYADDINILQQDNKIMVKCNEDDRQYGLNEYINHFKKCNVCSKT